MAKREDLDEERMREARRSLDAVDRDSETIGRSTFVRAADKTRDHFLAHDKAEEDPIEIWGSRIGRLAGLAFAIGLVVYLAVTYVLPS